MEKPSILIFWYDCHISDSIRFDKIDYLVKQTEKKNIVLEKIVNQLQEQYA